MRGHWAVIGQLWQFIGPDSLVGPDSFIGLDMLVQMVRECGTVDEVHQPGVSLGMRQGMEIG